MPTLAVHNRFGPSVGHLADQPVSFEMPLPSGPRQQGQSVAEAAKDRAAISAIRQRDENFTLHS
jgi:hypothetical protein